MRSTPTLTFTELKDALTPQHVLNLAMIHGAMAMGILMFGLIALYLFMNADPAAAPKGADTARVLSLVHLGLACGAFVSAPMLFGLLLDRTAKAATSPTKALAGIQTAYLTRLALLEGVAMFGSVVFFLMNRSLLNEHPAYALNALTPVLFLLFVAMTFPTRGRLEDLLRERISQGR